jgi:hypothetical protein
LARLKALGAAGKTINETERSRDYVLRAARNREMLRKVINGK